jgi:hypothetical protein
MASIADLPPEITERIAASLSLPDLRNFRLTSRWCENHTYQHFSQRCFQTLDFRPDPQDCTKTHDSRKILKLLDKAPAIASRVETFSSGFCSEEPEVASHVDSTCGPPAGKSSSAFQT